MTRFTDALRKTEETLRHARAAALRTAGILSGKTKPLLRKAQDALNGAIRAAGDFTGRAGNFAGKVRDASLSAAVRWTGIPAGKIARNAAVLFAAMSLPGAVIGCIFGTMAADAMASSVSLAAGELVGAVFGAGAIFGGAALGAAALPAALGLAGVALGAAVKAAKPFLKPHLDRVLPPPAAVRLSRKVAALNAAERRDLIAGLKRKYVRDFNVIAVGPLPPLPKPPPVVAQVRSSASAPPAPQAGG